MGFGAKPLKVQEYKNIYKNMKKVLDFWIVLWYNIGIMKTTIDDYISYLSTILYFKSLPLWKKQLYSYENNHRPVITLPPSDAETAHKALNHILSLPISHSPDL